MTCQGNRPASPGLPEPDSMHGCTLARAGFHRRVRDIAYRRRFRFHRGLLLGAHIGLQGSETTRGCRRSYIESIQVLLGNAHPFMDHPRNDGDDTVETRSPLRPLN